MKETVQKILFDYILNADRVQASELLENYAMKFSYYNALKDILEPALLEIGNKWQKENLALAHGYIAGKIAEDFLQKAMISPDFQSTNTIKGNVVIGNIQDDYHALGRKMLGTFLQASGWKVYDLGNDVLPADFVSKAIETDAKIIGASAMMYSTALNIQKLRKEIDDRGLKNKIILAVGGAIFNLRPELVKKLGGDITSFNAIDADIVFTEALLKLKKGEKL
ncbi:MAG: hypothetical protein A2015_16555 [Spirochaetes bacterium GWF1_31_7]|nr:MAG: hypothetical protein A2Y30_13920 [Spirochaetes bacterium GWE1_32_154]OHD50056.1 MAG: hypothetical protein A2Y29_11965 [Spirochaetes bacterium GWE2_31_10]OHD52370.1 MAG: hypothetical protein A2015_16555 [Spirochaetes bacterium GWF1_31_7]OHD81686.1 MAG: hypothetical protein A2355_07405 [Spirochaetes bacterium RIFOXYB1_FULL_32_8]HBD96010.1 corrinoid-binding protein [Spirochaetia bacterium]